jgi:class 3 adenylate cyclase
VLRARVDRPRCVGAGNCITIAPTAFDWHEGDFGKAGIADVTSVEEEQLREAALACPTQAIVLEEVEELLPWQLRGRAQTQRVQRTFMFTDIVGSTNLVEALGDEAWENLLGWHDQTLRKLFMKHCGEEVKQVGDGFFVAFDEATEALECAAEIQRLLAEHRKQNGFAPQVRIGLHKATATRKGQDYGGKGVHAAARVGGLAAGGEIIATTEVMAETSSRFPVSEARSVSLKGVSEPVEIVSVLV